MKNPAPQSARGSDESWKILHGSLAVFNVEQVALNRHEQYFKDNVHDLSHSHSDPVNRCHKEAQKPQKNLWWAKRSANGAKYSSQGQARSASPLVAKSNLDHA